MIIDLMNAEFSLLFNFLKYKLKMLAITLAILQMDFGFFFYIEIKLTRKPAKRERRNAIYLFA